MTNYSQMTQEEFNEILEKLLGAETPGNLLAIPGVYEVVSEHFNNAVLEDWAQDNPEKAWPEEEDDD